MHTTLTNVVIAAGGDLTPAEARKVAIIAVGATVVFAIVLPPLAIAQEAIRRLRARVSR